MDDIIKEFVVEGRESLDRVERDLVALEKTPGSRDLLASVFRSVHTIKGSSGFLALNILEAVAHAGESLLSRLRDGKLILTPEITTALLALVDALRSMLSTIERTGTDGSEKYASLVAELTRLQSASPQPATTSLGPTQPASPPPVSTGKPAVLPSAPVAVADTPSPAPVKISAAPVAPPPATEPTSGTASSSTETHVRVDVGLLDKLMNLVGELVLARNQVLQLNEGREDAALATTAQRLNLVTAELQEEVMRTRLQPIGNVCSKFPRVVRDLSQELRKQVRLEMEGEGTELDRTLIEAVKDPLTHLVRNAIDHGIETPSQRTASGKPETGRLSFRAYHEGGQVNIEIQDDGRGIDAAKVTAKAVERGFLTADQAARLSQREALNLIFLPGLTTAQKVTNVSGRGVGMDVVKTNIEKAGGSVDIQSEAGRGTTIKIKIPLTLAIIPALMVTCGQERYAIPQVSLVELVRLDGERARTGIETVMGAPVFRLRGQLLPLVYLREALKVTAPETITDEAVNIVVVQADEHQFGLVVDKISDTQEIVVKPLGKHFKGIPAFAGATILGDGTVALILDVLGLAQTSQIVSKARDRRLTETTVAAASTSQQRQRLLLFSLGDDRRLAIDLATVGRLEKFPRTMLERAGSNEVVQYRGQIMKLMRIADCLSYQDVEGANTDSMQVVVYSEQGRSVGLIVGRILDIVEDAVRLQTDDTRAGLLGKAVIQGRVTELLDVPGLVRQFNPEFAATV